MGSVMDQERPWEEEERVNGYWKMPIESLEKEVAFLKELPWEHAAYRQAKQVYDQRMAPGGKNAE